MVTFISHSPGETEALGEGWGRAVESGLVIGLTGELGAGKTQLVKGLARGLEVKTRVQSPTFALVNVYSGGRLPLFHLDLYRLDTREQIASAGLEEYLQPAGVTVIEWAERWFGGQTQRTEDGGRKTEWALPSAIHGLRLRWVRIETLSETDRHINYEDIGA